MRDAGTTVGCVPGTRELIHKGRTRMTGEVIVVGAGPGGLAAAMLLAKDGHRVTVLEQQDRIGGRCATLRAGEYRFDIGPTFFLYPHILREIFAACGYRLDDEVELVRLDPQYDLLFDEGEKISATGDLDRLTAEIARLSPADADAIARYFRDNRSKLKAFSPILQRPFNRLTDYLSPSVIKSLPLMRPFSSVDRDLARYFSDERVRLAFSFQSKYLGMSPFNCPSLFTILAFMEYEYGVFHPIGGCGAVTEAMARVAREMGVRIYTQEPVERLTFEGRRITGVETGRSRYRADALVANADFGHFMSRLVPNHLRRRWRDERLARKKLSCSTFMMYLGIEGRYDSLAHHTISIADDFRRNVEEITTGAQVPQHPSLYIQNACVTDPDLAPPGHSTLYVLAPVGNLRGGVDWSVETAAFREVVLDRLADIGLADLRQRIRYEHVMTPQTWQDELSVYEGATFNLAHNFGQMLYFRPHNRFEDLDGVYLVGGGTHPGSGLPVIFESARITSRLVAEDLGVAHPAGRAGVLANRDLAELGRAS